MSRIARMMLAAVALGGWLAGAEAVATAPEPPPGIGVVPGLLQATLGLAVVLALIWGAAWLIRRVAPMTGQQNSPIKVIAAQSLGQRERVVLVEIGEQWLVLGVAPGQVNALHSLPRSVVPATRSAHPFGRLLATAKACREG